jgi:WD40 repeat protein
MKVLATGGPTLTLCNAPSGRGGSWNQDEVIIFSSMFDGVIEQVAAAGGDPIAITEHDTTASDRSHRWPVFLPNGRDFLFFARSGSGEDDEGNSICVGTLGQPGFKRLFEANSNPGFADGQLLFVRDNALMAQPFDLGKLETTGDAFPIAERVSYVQGWSRGVFSVSGTGLLAYREGEVTTGSILRIYGLEGKVLGEVGEQSVQYSLAVSHDQTRVAVGILDQSSNNNDIWIRDIQRGIRNRLTFDGDTDLTPVWSPDDTEIAYASRRSNRPGVYIKSASGAGEERLVWATDESIFITDWSPDGRYLTLSLNQGSNRDIMVVPVSGDEEPFPVMQTGFNEWEPTFSPDGRWIAFTSDESGKEEIYVAPFPGPGGKWQVSLSEGDRARWRPDGKAIYYLDNLDRINVAEVEVIGDAMRIGQVTPLFPVTASRPGSIYSLMDGGNKFLVNERNRVLDQAAIVLVQNWSRDIGR